MSAPTTRTALVTGGARGIGAAIASVLRANGMRVLTPTRAEMDLQSDASVDAFLSRLSEPVDILVNNAGINTLAAIDEASDQAMHEVMQINLITPMRLARGLVPGMKERRYGRIVNISSIWSFVSKPRRNLYAAAKSGLNGLTRNLAVELAPYNILVNGVAPGFVNTELTRQNNSPEEIAAICQQIPLGKMAEPNDIAEFVHFLCSDKNQYATGQTFLVDGGFSCA